MTFESPLEFLRLFGGGFLYGGAIGSGVLLLGGAVFGVVGVSTLIGLLLTKKTSKTAPLQPVMEKEFVVEKPIEVSLEVLENLRKKIRALKDAGITNKAVLQRILREAQEVGSEIPETTITRVLEE